MVLDTLTVSSKGQIVFPVSIRKRLSINAGSKLAAYVSGDIIMLKVINMPSEDDFRSKLDEAQEWAKEVGYTEDDVNDVIKSVRRSYDPSKFISEAEMDKRLGIAPEELEAIGEVEFE